MIHFQFFIAFLGNRPCIGRNFLEQSNFCHFDLDARHRCSPSPIVINAGENISIGDGENFCVCAFRKGQFICSEGERNCCMQHN